MSSLLLDLRYGLRMLAKHPGFTIVAVLTLALGIGANTAIFGLINTLMLRMLPVHKPEQLVQLLNRYPGEPRGSFFSLQGYQYYRDYNHVFSGLIGSYRSRFNLRIAGGVPDAVDGDCVTGNFFPVLGVKPAIGRLIGPEDDHVGAAASAVAVVSWSYWKGRFNLDRGILGKQIVVEDVSVTVIGVAPRDFSGLQTGFKSDIWLPLALEPMIHHPSQIGGGGLKLMARLRPSVSIEQARAEMKVLFRFTIEERSKNSKDPLVRRLEFEMEPVGTGFSLMRDRFAQPLLVLMTIVGLLLLISCTSLASMLLARGAARQHEMALRISLGAGRFRLIWQVLTESLLLSAAGGLLAVFLAYYGARTLMRILESGRQMSGLAMHIDVPILPDMHVLLFTAGIALFTTLLFGLAPAWNAFTSSPASSLQKTARAGETKFRRLLGKTLVVMQVALSVALLSAAGLFVLHLSNLEHLDLGFRRDHVLLITLDRAHSGYDPEYLSRVSQELLQRIQAIPGVRWATLSAGTPISGASAASFAIVEGYQERPEDRRYVLLNWVAPKYFETLGTPLLTGRDFNFQDQGGPRVAIINQAMARYYFPNGNAIGKHVALERDRKGFGVDKAYEIVGIVRDAKYNDIREAPPRTIYFNMLQDRSLGSQVVVRTSIDPAAVAGSVRRAVNEMLKTVPVARVTTLAEQVDASIVPERLIATLSGSFGVLGSLLAAIGLYGLLAYTVARRTNEIGVRMALGATRGDVARMVIADALGMASAGLAIGVLMALWAKRFAATLIQDLPLKSTFPIVFGALAMVAVALLAAYLPARRAARVDPVEALRYE